MMFCNNDAWKPLLLAVVSVFFFKSWKVLVSIVLKRNHLHCKEKNFSSPVNCSSGYEIVFYSVITIQFFPLEIFGEDNSFVNYSYLCILCASTRGQGANKLQRKKRRDVILSSPLFFLPKKPKRLLTIIK